ncbi:MAG: acyltransferase domain-containing protein [Candidatus Dormibacteria bacterium]
MLRIALCFPGQGSQTPGMAAGLDGTDLGGRLRAVAAAAGVDLAPAWGGDDDAALRRTEIAQPALVLTEMVLAAALPSRLDVVVVAGHSVGEFAACAAAGALAPEDALRLVIERSRLMAAMTQGTMAAVLGLDAVELARLCERVDGTVVVANLNAPGQVVISGTEDAVAAAGDLARTAGARRVVPLRVGGAFHSPLMADAAAAFARAMDAAPLRAPRVPVVTNVGADPVTDVEILRDRMRRQMGSPVQWEASVRRMVEMGVQALVEVGPGAVLTGLARRAAPGIPALCVDSLSAAADLAGRLAAEGGE